MKIFLSWSKPRSKELAIIFNDWLPNVLQYVNTYMSADSEKLGLGERSYTNIQENLEESSFGLIFVTPENIESPWINFEAGALSKKMESKVIPILYEADLLLLDKGPLKQFQSAKDLSKDNIYSLLKSINSSSEPKDMSEKRLEIVFEKWWPDLDEKIKNISKINGNKPRKKEPSTDEIIKEIYKKVSQQDDFIRKQVNNDYDRQQKINPKVVKDLRTAEDMLTKYVQQIENQLETTEDSGNIYSATTALMILGRAINHIQRNVTVEYNDKIITRDFSSIKFISE